MRKYLSTFIMIIALIAVGAFIFYADNLEQESTGVGLAESTMKVKQGWWAEEASWDGPSRPKPSSGTPQPRPGKDAAGRKHLSQPLDLGQVPAFIPQGTKVMLFEGQLGCTLVVAPD